MIENSSAKKNTKILFIYPNIGQPMQYHHGIASLSAILEQSGYETSLFIVDDDSYSPLKEKISSFAPRMICFSIVSNYWELSNSLAKRIKQDFDTLIFAGGMHCSIFPQSYTPESSFDGICRAEGEYALLELADRIESGEDFLTVRNFWFKSNRKIITNDIRPLISNLDDLPFPNRDIFPDNPGLGTSFMFSRGCPFQCTYCSNKAYNELTAGKGKIVRSRSVNKAIEEIVQTVSNYKPQALRFDDDSFNKNQEWFKEFAAAYSKEKSLPAYRCNTRPELVSESSIQLFKESGCYQLNIGIESGDPKIRQEVLNRHMTDTQIIEAFHLAKKCGIQRYSFNMIGIPGETISAFKRTIRLNRIIQPDKSQIAIFFPYPGTELGDYCVEKGYPSIGDDVYNYFHQSFLNLPGFSKRRILINRIFFKFNVYRVSSLSRALYYLYRDIREFLEYRSKICRWFFNLISVPVRFLRK